MQCNNIEVVIILFILVKYLCCVFPAYVIIRLIFEKMYLIFSMILKIYVYLYFGLDMCLYLKFLKFISLNAPYFYIICGNANFFT